MYVVLAPYHILPRWLVEVHTGQGDQRGMHVQRKAGIGAGMQPLQAHLFHLTVDGFNRMVLRAQRTCIQEPCMWLHVGAAHGNQADLCLRLDARFIGGTGIAVVPAHA